MIFTSPVPLRALAPKMAILTAACLLLPTAAAASGPSIELHDDVSGPSIESADVRPAGGAWRHTEWDALSRTPVDPGHYELRLKLQASSEGGALRVPVCAGRGSIRLDGRDVPAPRGPVVVPLSPGAHALVIGVDVSGYERRIACGEAIRAGARVRTREGLGLVTFDSPQASRGGGEAVVFLPPERDRGHPRPLLVGLHPWNGSPWTYAAYAELLREAQARDVLLLMPSGLGNSLYTAEAEREVLRAIDAIRSAVAIDPLGISVWGASMGGAGATTIGLHHPDRFASVTTFFGDSRYDLSTYVRSILPSEAAAHAVNALDVVENARNLPVWLLHGEDDRTSPIRQSEILAQALRQRGFPVRFDRAPGIGHSGALVAQHVAEVVAVAATRRAPTAVARVSFRSVRPEDMGAYGVRFDRASPEGDAFVDVERKEDGVHVLSCSGIKAIHFRAGALGTTPDKPPRIVMDDCATSVPAEWEHVP